jgi:hypothetical protein
MERVRVELRANSQPGSAAISCGPLRLQHGPAIAGTHERLIVSGDDGVVVTGAVEMYRQGRPSGPVRLVGVDVREAHEPSTSASEKVRDRVFAKSVARTVRRTRPGSW